MSKEIARKITLALISAGHVRHYDYNAVSLIIRKHLPQRPTQGIAKMKELMLLRLWVHEAYLILPHCKNPEIFSEVIGEQEVKFWTSGFEHGWILGA